MHVRRGDYVGGGQLLPLEYFEAAARVMSSTVPENSSIFVFSDDIQWTREQRVFTDLPGVVFVDESDTLTSFYYLVLAAEGGIVCSNSTFCWWAAFLSAGRRMALESRLAIFAELWAVDRSLTGLFGDKDCGVGLYLPFMTILPGFPLG